jgi:hypothetical protein
MTIYSSTVHRYRMENPFEKKYTDALIAALKKGVQYEQCGDMEPDICQAEQEMEEAATVIKQLLKVINSG